MGPCKTGQNMYSQNATKQKIDSRENQTHFILKTNGGVTIPNHKHNFDEILEVIDGRMVDLISGKEYKKGEKMHANAGDLHGITLYNAIVSIKVMKKLPLSTDYNINLDNMEAFLREV